MRRMLHERLVTNCFTPVKLGEIIGRRSLRKDGKVNEYAVTKHDKVLGISARGDDLTQIRTGLRSEVAVAMDGRHRGQHVCHGILRVG